jgi:hypothetical protein
MYVNGDIVLIPIFGSSTAQRPENTEQQAIPSNKNHENPVAFQ